MVKQNNKLKRIDNFNFECIKKINVLVVKKIFVMFKIVRNIINELRNEFLQNKKN